MLENLFTSSLDQETVQLMRTDLKRLEGKIDLLLKHAGLEYDPYAAISESVADALRAGRKIEAIKIYRAETGASLREAKDYVEAVAD